MAGQIFKKRDGVWMVRVALGRDASGVRKYHSKTIYGTKKDAENHRAKVLNELSIGTFVQPSKMLVADFLRLWISEYKPNLRERTRESYSFLLETYVIPHIGLRKLSDVHPTEIQRLWNGMTSRGLSPRTVRYTHAVVRGAFRHAVKLGMLIRNPADFVELPAKSQREIKALEPEQVRAFLEAARTDKWYALWFLLLTTGLRPGEALALKWSDIDFGNGSLSVRRVVVNKRDGGWTFADPKTQKSKRRVTIPATVVGIMAQWQQEQMRRGMTSEFVFPNEVGGPLDYKALKQRHFKKVLRVAGVENVRPYDLRHTCATLLLEAGTHPKIVSERLGHSTTAMTMETYTHVQKHMQQQVAEKLDEMLFSPTIQY